MPKRFYKYRIPYILLAVPTVWLIMILCISFRFDTGSNKHLKHNKIKYSGFLPGVAVHENEEINLRIRNHEAGAGDFLNEFEREDELEQEQQEKEIELQNLINLEEAGLIDHADIEAANPNNSLEEFPNPFIKKFKDDPLLAGSEMKGQIVDGRAFQNQEFVKGTSPLGEKGVPVLFSHKLSPEEQIKFDEGLKTYQFNTFISNTISVRRSLPDIRKDACKNKEYSTDLPPVSIIICFYNEAWSILLRTLHSVIDRAPYKLITEIILVDDNSNLDHLKTPLEEYLKKELPKVKLIRSDVRLGLVRARLLAVDQAQSDILVFLDSHIECLPGWLEPLIAPLVEDSQTIVTPIIEMIHHLTFGLSTSGEGMIGTFYLPHMSFAWSPVPRRLLDKRKSPDDYYLSPTMAGGLFSITKEYFNKLGGYDRGLELWGSENLELSFKAWLCGGRIIINPCSHIGHIFRLKSPYLNETHFQTISRNKARIAEVWLDDYKQFYMAKDKNNFGDVSAQKKLKSDLKCHNFDWYIRNVYPELYVPGVGPQFGEILNEGSKFCMVADREKPLMVQCDQAPLTVWDSSRINEIRFQDICLDVSERNEVILSKCRGDGTTQVFLYTQEGFIIHSMTKLCLTGHISKFHVELLPCIRNIMQDWGWSTNPNFKPL